MGTLYPRCKFEMNIVVQRENQHLGICVMYRLRSSCASFGSFLYQESLLYTSIPLRRNVSARISLRGLRMLISVDTLLSVHNVGFLVERLK